MSSTHHQSQSKRRAIVIKPMFAAILLAAMIAMAPAKVCAQQNLNQNQAALYLSCIAVSTGGTLSTNITPNTLTALLLMNQQTVSQAQTLPALQGMTFIQLAQAMQNSMKNYEKNQLGCQKKCVQAALNLFQTQSQSSCLSIASGFAQ
jgi:hypothetical protein